MPILLWQDKIQFYSKIILAFLNNHGTHLLHRGDACRKGIQGSLKAQGKGKDLLKADTSARSAA